MRVNSSSPHSPDPTKTQLRKASLSTVPDKTVYGTSPISPSTPKISAQHTKQSFVSTVNPEKVVSHGLSRKNWIWIFPAVFKSPFPASSRALQRKSGGNSPHKKSSPLSPIPTFPRKPHFSLETSIKSERVRRASHLW